MATQIAPWMETIVDALHAQYGEDYVVGTDGRLWTAIPLAAPQTLLSSASPEGLLELMAAHQRTQEPGGGEQR